MAYIETHQSLLTHRKTLRLGRLLGMDRFCVCGRLMALWCWALDNAPDAGVVVSGGYRVILADPPWRYYTAANWRLRRKGIDVPNSHYETMTPAQIAALPVGDLACPDDAALFLWVTMPLLEEGIATIRAWGFRYVTVAFAWVNVNRDGTPFVGLGQYTRANVELCLLGVRGRMQRRRLDRGVPQVIVAPVREHSRKPDEVYGRIMRLFEGPYVECFARQVWPGWDVAYSNQANLFVAQPPLVPEGAA